MRVRPPERLSLLLILLLGSALRLYRLGADSLWYDETVSVYLAGSPLGELIRHTAGDIHPPGYYTLLRGWLLTTGYPTGHADPAGNGLEFAAGFLSLACGVVLIALAYSLARSLADRTTALTAAMIVALSPYNIWYSQETRMYTLAASLGAVALIALLRGVGLTKSVREKGPKGFVPWAAYAFAAAAGLYTVYYFAFLLLALNLWVVALLLWRKLSRDRTLSWLLANLAALALYVPWAPVAWRQVTSPPVPPWRSATGLIPALRESWIALSLGQSAPTWLWPVLLLAIGLYAAGLLALLGVAGKGERGAATPIPPDASASGSGVHPIAATFLPVATFGSLGFILMGSALASPLYHVRYVFTYSPAFYVVLAAGFVWVSRRWRALAAITGAVWIAGAAVTLHTFWHDPAYRPDDLRGAAEYLESRWRPADVVLVNAGYAYPGLLTYWQGAADSTIRLAAEAPAASADGQVAVVVTGHLDGDPMIGWGDPRSDFFALPADQAKEGLKALFRLHPRIWHYRIYDTVSDPDGRLRAMLDQDGQPIEDQVFAGEANLRVQGFVPRSGAPWAADRATVHYTQGLDLQWEPLPRESVAGRTLYPVLTWRAAQAQDSQIATSIRLVGADGVVWSQPLDEQPLGKLFTSERWPAGQTVRQPLAMPVPPGTPPGDYTVELVVYDPANGAPLEPTGDVSSVAQIPGGVALAPVTVRRPETSGPTLPSLGQFGPLALVEARTPATVVAPGDEVPVELLWQAAKAPGEPLVVVVQLLDQEGRVVAGLEAQPLEGRYPTQSWAEREVVRDRHTLTVPAGLVPGSYRLVAGVYRAADGQRFKTRSGLWGETSTVEIRQIQVR